MPKLSSEDRDAIIDAVIRRKFGKLLEWVRPTLLHTFGPNNLEVADQYEAKLRLAKDRVFNTLSAWSDEEIQKVGDELKDVSRIEESAWGAIAASTIDELFRHPPKPVVFGFGHPSFKADFAYWGSMPTLTIYEAVALSVGADPAAFTEEKITELLQLHSKGGKLWASLAFLIKQFEIFRRHFTHTGWGFIAERPSKLKAWIDEIELPVHPEFYSELAKRSPAIQPAAQPTASAGLARQERETLLKLIAAMACEQYNYDPSKERSEATSRILEDIELVGLTMDAKTIRKWLKEASELVDPSYWNRSD
jgi:hypothetical protein